MTELHLWLRHEVRSTERRTPLVPSDARRLVERGVTLTVEESPQRIFPVEEYEAAGCRIAPAGSWVSAPERAVVLGLKELPDQPAELTHAHIFFGHAYKRQPGAEALLRRFAAGGGTLLDLEYLVDDDGRRLAAFGFWAGYLGAALAVLQHRGRLTAPLTPLSKDELDALLRPVAGDEEFTALVIGAWAVADAVPGSGSSPPGSRRRPGTSPRPARWTARRSWRTTCWSTPSSPPRPSRPSCARRTSTPPAAGCAPCAT